MKKGKSEIGKMKTASFISLFFLFPLLFSFLLTGCLLGDDAETIQRKLRELNPPVITINTQPAATTGLTAGGVSGSLTVAASATWGTLNYRWFSNTVDSNSEGSAIPISGATSASFTIPATLVAGTYYYYCMVYCVVSETHVVSVRSDVAAVTVSALPAITINTHPVAMTNVTAGSISRSLSVTANVTQGATLSYQWFSNTANSNSGGTAVSGATSANFGIPTGLTAGTHYYFAEVRATGGAVSVRSNVATVTVSAPAVPVITINTHPVATTNVTAGSISGSLNVTANATLGQL